MDYFREDIILADRLVWPILFQLILIALNAVFACAEIAVISMNGTKLSVLAEQGDRRAKRLSKLTAEPAKFLATIQVAITLSGFLGSAFAANNFSEYIVRGLINIGAPEAWEKTLNTIAVVLITLILSYITLIFGELVPKRLAMKKTEQLALGMASLVFFISKLFAPIVFILTKSTNAVLRLLGIDPNAKEDEVSEEEIRMMVDSGSESGVIDVEEKDIIQNVFEFDDLEVGEFCTHRTNLDVLYAEETIDEWDKVIHDTRHSLYPVCDESVDKVIGVLSTKDYFRMENRTKESVMEKAVKPAYFIPESIHADLLLKQMKQTRNHFAVVLDEYGGTAGIVTMNDLLEQLVGDLETEPTPEEQRPEIEKIGENQWKILGCAPLEEVAEQLDVTLPVDDYDTFGGFVFSSYGVVPDDGTTFEIDIDRLHVVVTEIRDHRIEGATVTLLPEQKDSEEEDDEKKTEKKSEKKNDEEDSRVS